MEIRTPSKPTFKTDFAGQTGANFWTVAMFYIHADGTCERGGDACFNTRADAERYIATMEANATLPTPYERSRSA